METYHVPVMLDESIELLDIRPGGTYVDVTFGGGGHSRGILERLSDGGRLFAFDQDRDARRNLPDDPRLVFVESNFRFMRGWLRCHGVERVDGILADLGVSSHHFDTRERGFSFRFDAPLDMRMNQRAALTAADVVNKYDHAALTRILRDYGELDVPHGLRPASSASREQHPLRTDRRAGRLRRAGHSPGGREQIPLEAVSGAAYRGERRDGGFADDARAVGARTSSGRASGRDRLSFAGRPDGEEFHAQRPFRRASREGFLWPGPLVLAGADAQGPYALRRRGGAQSAFRSAKLRAAVRLDEK